LDAELTTRPIAGVDWAVDTAFVYNKRNHPKTIPVLARHLIRRLAVLRGKNRSPGAIAALKERNVGKRGMSAPNVRPGQKTTEITKSPVGRRA
jgi:hypothetical protein